MTTFRKLPMQAPRTKTTAGKNQGCIADTSARAPVMGPVWIGTISVAKSLRRRPPHGGGRLGGGNPRPGLERLGALVDQHAEAVGMRDAELPRLAEEPGDRRIVDHVVHGGQTGEQGEVRGRKLSRAEPRARRIDDKGAPGQALGAPARVKGADRDPLREGG